MKPNSITGACLVAASHILPARSETPILGVATSQGCFSSSGSMTAASVSPYFVSTGSCASACRADGFTAMALHASSCLCGDAYPPESSEVDDAKCDYACPGYAADVCGGEDGYYSVYNLGVKISVPYDDGDLASTTADGSSESSATAVESATSVESTTAVESLTTAADYTTTSASYMATTLATPDSTPSNGTASSTGGSETASDAALATPTGESGSRALRLRSFIGVVIGAAVAAVVLS